MTPGAPPAWVTALHTERLLLRPAQASDLPDLLAVNGDDEVTRFLPYASWQGLGDGQAWLQRMQAMQAAGTGQQLVLESRPGGSGQSGQGGDHSAGLASRVIGGLILFKLDAPSARIELGYVLGRAHWGQGLMAEAATATIEHLFGSLGLRRIEAEVNPLNRASTQLLQRLGFVHEGSLRQRWAAKGSTCDTHLYGCLQQDWRQRGQRAAAS